MYVLLIVVYNTINSLRSESKERFCFYGLRAVMSSSSAPLWTLLFGILPGFLIDKLCFLHRQPVTYPRSEWGGLRCRVYRPAGAGSVPRDGICTHAAPPALALAGRQPQHVNDGRHRAVH